MGYRRWEEVMRENPFLYFSDDQLWLFNFQPISQNWSILISTHPFAKLKIILESLWSREDMAKNPFLNFKFFTSENPCDSSPPPRQNHEPGTSEKFWKHGFSFFNPNIPISLETRTKILTLAFPPQETSPGADSSNIYVQSLGRKYSKMKNTKLRFTNILSNAPWL